jgi:hypothetical protein
VLLPKAKRNILRFKLLDFEFRNSLRTAKEGQPRRLREFPPVTAGWQGGPNVAQAELVLIRLCCRLIAI